MEVNGTRQALKAEKYVKADESSFCLSEATLRINIMRLKSRKSWEKSHVLRSKLIFYLKAVWISTLVLSCCLGVEYVWKLALCLDYLAKQESCH